MSRQINWATIIQKERVSQVPQQEAEQIQFIHRVGKKSYNIEKILAADKTLSDVVDILRRDPNATVKIENTIGNRVVKLRKDLMQILGARIQIGRTNFDKENIPNSFGLFLRINK